MAGSTDCAVPITGTITIDGDETLDALLPLGGDPIGTVDNSYFVRLWDASPRDLRIASADGGEAAIVHSDGRVSVDWRQIERLAAAETAADAIGQGVARLMLAIRDGTYTAIESEPSETGFGPR